jgi:hypothetical protein
MTEHTAESTARNATGHAARTSVVEAEADSVAVAVKEAGTNRTKRQSPIRGLFFCGKKKPAAAYALAG